MILRSLNVLLLFLVPGNFTGTGGRQAPGEVRNYSIFGEDHSRVEIKDNSLKGTVYYLISGHGGPDPGASGKYGNNVLAEDEYAYDITLRLAKSLIEHGALVYMITRDSNDGIREESILKSDNDERCYPDLKIPSRLLPTGLQRVFFWIIKIKLHAIQSVAYRKNI